MTPELIILHHSRTKDSKTLSMGAIRRFHIEVNGWDDIGYHFVIEQIRDSYEILLGRMPDRMGAHCQGQNSRSIGICFVGNFDYSPPPPDQWSRGLELISFLLRQYNLTHEDVKPHSDFNTTKTCPGRMFDMGLFCAELRRLIEST